MNLFLDCEFNGFGGELISMALVDEEGHYFYEVLDCPQPVAWVAEHVMPLLAQAPISFTEFQNKLSSFFDKLVLGPNNVSNNTPKSVIVCIFNKLRTLLISSC